MEIYFCFEDIHKAIKIWSDIAGYHMTGWKLSYTVCCGLTCVSPPQTNMVLTLRILWMWPYLITPKMRQYWIRVGPKSKDWCPHKGSETYRHTDTPGRWPCGNGGSAWHYAAVHQRVQWVAHPPETRRDNKVLLPEAFRKICDPGETLILSSGFLCHEGINFCYLKKQNETMRKLLGTKL